MKKILIPAAVIVLALIGWLAFLRAQKVPALPAVMSFEDCAKAGYPVMESQPRQCRTPDGRTYAEELPQKATYANSSADLIAVYLPFPGAVTGKTFSVTGKARGTWYFEASFPIEVLDNNGKVLAQTPAKAQGDWMTADFVPFKAELTVPQSYVGPATIVLKKDNPSGMPERDASVSIPITIEY